MEQRVLSQKEIDALIDALKDVRLLDGEKELSKAITEREGVLSQEEIDALIRALTAAKKVGDGSYRRYLTWQVPSRGMNSRAVPAVRCWRPADGTRRRKTPGWPPCAPTIRM